MGIGLPLAYLAPMVLFEVSGYLGRISALGWLSDLAILLSVPWKLVLQF